MSNSFEPKPADSSSALAIRQQNALSTHVTPSVTAELDESLHLRDILRIILKRKWWIVSIAALVFLVAALFTLLQTPIYRATTVVQIEKTAARIVEYRDGSSNPESGWSDEREFFTTQVELLRSKALAERVMETLRLDLDKAKLKRATDYQDANVEPSDDWIGRIIATWKKRQEPSVKDEQTLDRESVLSTLRAALTIEPVRNSRLVKIHVDNSDAALAARIANAWANGYIKSNLERRFEASSYAKTFLEQQLAQIKEKLETSERQLNEYTRQKQIVNVDEKTNLNAQNLTEFTNALAKAEQERIRAEATYEETKRNLGSAREVLDSKSVSLFRENMAKLEAEYQDQLKIYKPGFPKMQQLQAQITEIDRRIKTETEAIKASLEATARGAYLSAKTQETQLRARVDTAKRNVLDIQDQGIRYNILKREVDTNRELYGGLLQRFKEVGIAGGVGTNNISVADKADVPLFPFKPDLFRNAMIGLILGLMAGLALAFVVEYMDDSIKFPDEVERFTGMALLGAIPKVSSKQGAAYVQATSDPRSAAAEAYRSVRTALQFSTSSGAPRTLAITSCTKNEGKSTTAFAVAVALSQLGKRVLLVDGDMRNPSLHKMLGTDHAVGLSNLLSSNVEPISVTHTTAFENLYFISAGPLPPNPAELLMGPNMSKLLSPSSSVFDHIVIDAPPVLGIADSIVMCNRADASLFVIESSGTSKTSIRNALRRLRQAGVQPLGAILTKMSGGTGGYGYDSEYYYYGADDAALPVRA